MGKKGLGVAGCFLQAILVICITGVMVAGLIGWLAARDGVGVREMWGNLFHRPAVRMALAQPEPASTNTPPPPPPTAAPLPPAPATPVPTPTAAPAAAAAVEPPASPTPETAAPPASDAPVPTPATSSEPARAVSAPAAPPLPAQLTAGLLDPTTLYPGSPLPEHPATRLVIPALDVDQQVIMSPIVGQTWQVDHLDQKIGHLEGTASPGDKSNIVLAGHVTLAPDGRSGPFKNLGQLQPGEVAIVYRDNQPYYYVIDALHVVRPTDVQVTFPTSSPRLTLITCINYDRAQGRYSDRVVAVGHLIESPD